MTTWRLLIICVTVFLTVFLSVCIYSEAQKTVARIRDGRPDA